MGAHDPQKRSGWLSQALKPLRRLRRLRQPEVAARMGMRPRTFEHFEAGKGPFNIDRVYGFARALNVDPHAILVAVDIGSPEFALRSAENKLMTIIVMEVQRFNERTGDAIIQLDPQTIRAVVERAFNELGDLASTRTALAESWLKDGSDGSDPDPDST
jgi:transcriptional regulator with XRE-family HTH domain